MTEPGTDPTRLRVSDLEREQTASALREHYAAGRITEDELSERLDRTYAATTVAQLAELVEDLPALPPSPALRRAELAERRAHLRRQLIQQTGGSLGLFVVLSVIWLVSGATGGFWPAFVLIFPLISLLRNGWLLYGPAPELDRVEAYLQRHHRGQRHRPRGRRGRHHLGPGNGTPQP